MDKDVVRHALALAVADMAHCAAVGHCHNRDMDQLRWLERLPVPEHF